MSIRNNRNPSILLWTVSRILPICWYCWKSPT